MRVTVNLTVYNKYKKYILYTPKIISVIVEAKQYPDLTGSKLGTDPTGSKLNPDPTGSKLDQDPTGSKLD